MNNLLYVLWQSSESLHKRFDVYPPLTHKALRVMAEEAYEATEAALTEPIDLPYEVADLIVTAMGVMMSHYQDYEDLQHAIIHVIQKNDAKTTSTHAVNAAGKIARRG